MNDSLRWSAGVGLLALGMLALLMLGLAFPATAAPGAQGGDFLPTPTMALVENAPYTLDVVGGTPEPYTFSYADQDGFAFGETTVTSEYPLGMTFTLDPSSENGTIDEVDLFLEYVSNIDSRFIAEWDAGRGLWIARLWERGARPAWMSFDFYWHVRDSSGAVVDTEPNHVEYYDPDHEWFRSENDNLIVYWRGFAEDNPDAVAQTMANYVAGLENRLIEGFGAKISYKPTTVIYPDQEALAAMFGADVAESSTHDLVGHNLALNVQVLQSAEIPSGQEDCLYITPPDERTMEYRISMLYPQTVAARTVLYQHDVLGGSFGLAWWFEGQAEWFSNTTRNYDERLRNLATMQDLPSMQTGISANVKQADGCFGLANDAGASFINYLLANYGGLDLHRAIAQGTRHGTSVFDSVEELTGKPFLEIENEWRAYLGFRPLTEADLDPVLALELYEDSMIAVGDTVTLPAVPAIAPIYEDPKPKSLVNASCFGNTPVTILRMGQLDGVAYFEVDCMGQVGWMTRDQLVGP